MVSCKWLSDVLSGIYRVERVISAIIVTDDYFYVISNQKVLTTFFLILIFKNYLRLKLWANGNIERLRALL